jgi:hypothetical protein
MGKKMMSRNEYFQMIKEKGHIPSDDECGYYPLDLSKYPLTDETKRNADSNFTEETEDKSGNYMLSGHWMFGNYSAAFANRCGFTIKEVNSYNAYSYSDEQMAVFTYCEGDITLTLFTDKAKYEAEKAETIKFYEETYS